jgi:hypothetical protein
MRTFASFIDGYNPVVNIKTTTMVLYTQSSMAAVFLSFLFLVINRNRCINLTVEQQVCYGAVPSVIYNKLN